MNVRIYSLKKNPQTFAPMNIFFNKYSNIFEYPNICYTLDKTKKFERWQNSKAHIVTKPKNSNCEKTQKLICEKSKNIELWQK